MDKNKFTPTFNPDKKFYLVFVLVMVFFYQSVIAKNKKLIENPKNNVNLFLLKDNTSDFNEKVDILNNIGFEYLISFPTKSIETCKKAIELTYKKKYESGFAKANYILGVAYWMQGDYNEALKHLLISLKKYEKIKDRAGIADSLLNIGLVYAELNEYNEASEKYDQALNLYLSLELQTHIASTFTKMAAILIEKNKNKEALKYLTNALEINNQKNFTYGIAETHNCLAILYFRENNLHKAAYHINISIELGNSINNTYGVTNGMILFGKILRLQGGFNRAENILNIALQKAEDHNLKKQMLLGYNELKGLKTITNQPEQALFFLNKYTKLKDSLFNFSNAKGIALLEFNNQGQKSNIKLSTLKDHGKGENIIYYMLILIILMISVYTGVFYFYSRKRLAREKDLTRKNWEIIESQISIVEKEKLKQKELKQHLELKNKQLTSFAFNFQQKNRCINQLQDIVKNLEKASSLEKKDLIKELKIQVKENLISDKKWESFRAFFEEIQFGFHAKLASMHPTLTPNDLKLCSLLRLNLTVQESADILGISAGSLKTSKYRLRKKLNLRVKQEIISYLISLEVEDIRNEEIPIEEDKIWLSRVS
ncbi:MAG TPA: tetratricopeptide repeat protein [Mariniflexile sp.]